MTRPFLLALAVLLPATAHAAPHPTCQVEGPTGGRVILVVPESPAATRREPFYRPDPNVRLLRRPFACAPEPPRASRPRRR